MSGRSRLFVGQHRAAEHHHLPIDPGVGELLLERVHQVAVRRRQLPELPVADRGIDVDKLFTDRWKLDQASEAYQLFDKQNSGKGVFLPA